MGGGDDARVACLPRPRRRYLIERIPLLPKLRPPDHSHGFPWIRSYSELCAIRDAEGANRVGITGEET